VLSAVFFIAMLSVFSLNVIRQRVVEPISNSHEKPN
jgi:hypothetical protein